LLEADFIDLSCYFGVVRHGVVLFFGFGWGDVSDGFQQVPAIEPVDPFERCEFDRFK
jgi:hypothetical protein